MSTLSPAMEDTVARAIERARGTEPRAAQPYGTRCLTGSAPHDGATPGRVVSVPRRYVTCGYCGSPGATVCRACEDLPGLDTQRAPELYGRRVA